MKKQNLQEFKDNVNDLKEYELFFYIESLGYIKWREIHDYNDGRINMSEEVFLENQEYYAAIQNVCINVLNKFDIDLESIKNRKDGDYWKWYRYWKNWMREFSDEEWQKISKKLEKKESIENLLPLKKWNE